MSTLRQVIGIHGVPRSGTSWLGQIFNSSPCVAYRFQPLFSYAFKARIGPTSTRQEILTFFDDIHASQDDFLLQRDKLESGAYPDFHKHGRGDVLAYKEVRYHHVIENLLQQVPEARIVGVVRHPCAVLNSWLKAPREFHPEWDPLTEWRTAPSKNQGRPEEFYGFDKWKEVATLFLRLSAERPSQFRLVRYGDLVQDTLATVESLFEFAGLEVTPQTLGFLQASSAREHPDPYAVYRTRNPDAGWQDELPESIRAAVLAELQGTPLAQFLDLLHR